LSASPTSRTASTRTLAEIDDLRKTLAAERNNADKAVSG
jgi:hypothetical protein